MKRLDHIGFSEFFISSSKHFNHIVKLFFSKELFGTITKQNLKKQTYLLIEFVFVLCVICHDLTRGPIKHDIWPCTDRRLIIIPRSDCHWLQIGFCIGKHTHIIDLFIEDLIQEFTHILALIDICPFLVLQLLSPANTLFTLKTTFICELLRFHFLHLLYFEPFLLLTIVSFAACIFYIDLNH